MAFCTNSPIISKRIETIFGINVVNTITLDKGILYILETGDVYLQDKVNSFIIKEITDPVERLELAQGLFSGN